MNIFLGHRYVWFVRLSLTDPCLMQHQRHNPATAPGTSAKRDEGPGPQERSLEERLQFEEQLFVVNWLSTEGKLPLPPQGQAQERPI